MPTFTSKSSSSGQSGKMLRDVLSALAECGIPLPDDTDEENVLERLYVAATAVGAARRNGNGKKPLKEEMPVDFSTLGHGQLASEAQRRRCRLLADQAASAVGLPRRYDRNGDPLPGQH